MEALEERQTSLWLRRLFILLVLLVVSTWTALLLVRLIDLLVYACPDHDQSWYLYAAQRVIAGAQLYGPRLVETNPPLIIWFSTLPVFLGHLLHLDPGFLLKGIVIVLILGSVAWSARIVRAAGLADLPLFFYLVACTVLTAETFVNGLDIGQREHLLVILLLPYILFAACGSAAKLSLAERCVLGMVAGIAVCFKPQQVLVLVGLELFLVVWTRSLRRLISPGLLAAVLTVFAYLVLVRLAAPLYFSRMVPLLRDTYWAYGPKSALSLITGKMHFNVIFLLVFLVFLLLRRKLRLAGVTCAFLVCTLGSSLAFDIQHTGWSYQFYPQRAFLLLAILCIMIDFLSPAMKPLPANRTFGPAIAVSTLIFLAVFLPALILHRRSEAKLEARRKPDLDTIFAKYPPQTPVFLFATSLEAFPALSQYHLVWASRFPCLWMLPAIVRNELAAAAGAVPQKVLSPEVVKSLAAMQRADTTEDLHDWKPELVVVKHCHTTAPCQGLEHLDFDTLAWFLKSSGFAAEWANYRQQASQGDFDVYTRIR
jgi:hypothetical protein